MNIVIAGRRFAPSVLGTVLLILGIALTTRLGLWQLDRAEEKRALLAQFAVGEQTVLSLGPGSPDSLPRYQRVQARGRYDSNRQVLLDNMPSSSGRPGYRVLTPLELTSGGWLLVDRGWVPLGATREQLPNVAVEEQQRIVRGRIAPLPSPGLRLEAAVEQAGASWPRVLTYPTRAHLQTALQREVPGTIVLLDADQPDGFERDWNARLPVGPDRHIAYAVQWFAMGLAMLAIFVVMSLKRTSDR